MYMHLYLMVQVYVWMYGLCSSHMTTTGKPQSLTALSDLQGYVVVAMFVLFIS